MDKIYYNKYLKYKQKYLDLKKITDDINYLMDLKIIHPHCVHDNGNIKDAKSYSEKGYAITYGEMEYEALKKFYEMFNNYKFFIDFGSGYGRTVLYMGYFMDKSIGIELVTERHEKAELSKNKLSVKYPDIASKVKLINDDMFNYLSDITKETFSSPVLIWISNLCFGEEITKRLFDELIKKMPSDSIIGSSKIPNYIPDGIEPVYIDGKNNKLTVPMSWNKNSEIFIYKIK